MNCKHHRRVVYGELFIGSDSLLTPDIVSHVKPENAMGSLLVAFVFVGSPKMVNSDKLPQGIPKVGDTIDVYAEI